jgi:hypothetical protein
MHWTLLLVLFHLSIFSLISGTLALVTAETMRNYTIMDNDWSTTGFIPYLLALDADFEILGLVSSTCPWRKLFTCTYKYHRHCRHMAASSGIACCGNAGSWRPRLHPSLFWLHLASPQYSTSSANMGVNAWQAALAGCIRAGKQNI